MNAIEAVLLVIGFFSISVSFFMGRKEKTGTDEDLETDAVSKDVWTEKEEELVRERIHSILEEEKEDVLTRTKEILSRKSNEKIMEFDEFSSQLLEKISRNHDEVVFMYNTLTAKEEEWKEAAAKQNVAAARPGQENLPLKEQRAQAPEQPVPARKPEKVTEPLKERQPVQEPSQAAGQMPEPPVQVPQQTTGQPATGLEQLARKNFAKTKKPAAAVQGTATPLAENRAESVNDEIVKMHRQGMSVVEISKELNVGQGEVKLTIALYGGKR